MNLLDKITKWFFKTTKIEVNTDWRLVALDTNRKLIETEEKLQQAMQTIADKDKIIEIYKENQNDRTNFNKSTFRSCINLHLFIRGNADCS